MRFSTTEEWDEAGGVLQTMIATLMSMHLETEQKDDLLRARQLLQEAQYCLQRLGVYSQDFDPSIFFY